jgi:CHASE2 domain-containing sensor protein
VKLPRLRPTRRDMLVAALAAIFVLVLYAAGVLDNVERQSVDERFSWRGAQSPGSDIVIVGIDQTTLQTLGTRPSQRLL